MKNPLTSTSALDWQRLSSLRIAFGHQSVGYNLIAGMQSLSDEQHGLLSISETKAPFTAPGIQHFSIGTNGAPEGKIADFDAIMNNGVATSSDIALMKLCYIDFTPDTDATNLAKSYIRELTSLSEKYPHTVFVPVTAPLTIVQTGPKAWLKRLMGTAPGGYANNAARQAFNQALRAHYGTNSVLFDIAAIESGSGRFSVSHNDTRIEALNPALTTDGGHLNATGQRLVGGLLLHHLATTTRPQ